MSCCDLVGEVSRERVLQYSNWEILGKIRPGGSAPRVLTSNWLQSGGIPGDMVESERRGESSWMRES